MQVSWITISIVCNNTQFSLNSIQLELYSEQFVIHFTEGKIVSKSISNEGSSIRGLAKNRHVRSVVKLVEQILPVTCDPSSLSLFLERERERSFDGQSKVDKCNRVSLSTPYSVYVRIYMYTCRIFMCTADGMAPNNGG